MKKDKAVRKAELKAAVLSKLKSLAFPVILSAIIVAGILVVLNYQNVEEEAEIIKINGYEGDGKPLTLESPNLLFTMDTETTQFEVKVKSTGQVWYSNPQDVDSDPLAQGPEKKRLMSTLLVTYSTDSGLESTYDNYAYCIEQKVYEIEKGDDYIRVNYSIGDIEREYVIPPVAPVADFESWIAKMEQKDAIEVKKYYKLYDINDLGKKDNKEELLANYPILEQEPVYILRDTATDKLKVRIEKIFAKVGYSYEDYEAHKELSMATKSSDKPLFNINMIYRLDGDKLRVEIPMNEISFREKYQLYTLSVLPYMGAANADAEGYMLVPEGGGAIINFNNGKQSQTSYYANLYGWDMCLSRDSVVHNTRAYFNAFGVSNGENSFICTMEDGESYASVRAEISGKTNSYNAVNAVYSMVSREKFDVNGVANREVYVFTPELPDENIVQEYRFVDSGSYVDMAKEYRNYLQNRFGDTFAKNDDSSTPVAVEIVGAVDKVKQILGVPVSRPLKLTTYEEATDIMTELSESGIDNLYVKLTGWCNGGVKQQVLNRINTIGSLGSKKDLQNLIQTADELGVNFYLDGITQYAKNSNLLDGFNSYTNAARFISRERAELFQYSAITYAQREGAESYYLLHTDEAMKMANNLVTYADKLGAGVSFQDIGMDLSSDFYRKKTYSREAVKDKQIALLSSMHENGMGIMTNMGNEYAAVYSDMVTNMDLKGTEYIILDEYVPFYQIAIHGYVNYTGNPINICGNAEEELLKSAEYGAGLSFSLMNENAFALQKTLYTEYYGSDYAVYRDELLENYKRFNSELGHVYNQEIINHEMLTADLFCTTYEDGTKVYVNYGYGEAEAEGVKVPARDFRVVR